MNETDYEEHPPSSRLMEMQSALVNGQSVEVGPNKSSVEHSDSFPWDDDNCNSLGDEAPDEGAAGSEEMFLQEGEGSVHNSRQDSMGGEKVCESTSGRDHYLQGYQSNHAGGDGSHTTGLDSLDKHPEYVSSDDAHKGNLFRCDVCREAYHSLEALKEHMVHAGHFKCSMSECSTQIFMTSEELAEHQETAHTGQQFDQNSQHYNSSSFQHEQLYEQQQEQFQGFPQQQNLQPADNFLQQMQHLSQQISIQPRSFNAESPSQFGDQSHQQALTIIPPQSQNAMATPEFSNNNVSPSLQSSDFTNYSEHSNPPTSQSMPQIQARPFSNLSQTSPSNSPSKPVSPHPQIQLRPFSNLVQHPQGPAATPQLPGITITPQKRVSNIDGLDTPTKKHITEMLVGPGQEKVVQALGKMNPGLEIRAAADKGNASSVANMLATRGITVTPSGGPQKQPPQQPQQQQLPATKPSSLSITPSQGSGGSFQVPQGRGLISRQQQQQQQQQKAMQRPDRPPTVDLTREASPPRQLQMLQSQPQPMPRQMQPQTMVGRMRGRARPAGIGRFTCQICHKVFASMETLNNHMNLHRSPGKPPYRCNNCPAQYSSHHGLLIHQQACLRNSAPQPSKVRPAAPSTGMRQSVPMRQATSSVAGQAPMISQQQANDYGLIVVDMRNPATLNRLRSLGITSYLPFPSAGNIYGIPLINGNRPGNVSYLGVTHMILMGASMPLPR